MKIYDVIIIGGGASGCITALQAAKKNKNILIIDKNASLGKKLMVTGNGRCNLTNLNILPSLLYYNQTIDSFINRFSPEQAIEWFKHLGLMSFSDNEGRVYPITNSAKSVIDVLNNEIGKFKNISAELNQTCIDIIFKDEKYFVKTDKGEFISKKVAVACGGKSMEEILQKFEIPYHNFKPSLAAIKTEKTKILDGCRLSPALLSIEENGKKLFEERGEILFKDSGLSGIVAFNASTLFARGEMKNAKIILDLLPNFSATELEHLIESRKKLALPINKMFDGLLLPQLGWHILNKCKINEDRLSLQLNKNEIKLIVSAIKNLTFSFAGFYNNNQVYSGGVLLNALNDNLESKAYPGLYFCGEICDIDGKCGGYNLQWAWTSGYIVGEAL